MVYNTAWLQYNNTVIYRYNDIDAPLHIYEQYTCMKMQELHHKFKYR